MPRYLVERTFSGAPGPLLGAAAPPGRDALIGANSQQGVTWLHSYLAPERSRTWCVVDGPSPEAVRLAARATGLPVDRITEVRTLDPYACQPLAPQEEPT